MCRCDKNIEGGNDGERNGMNRERVGRERERGEPIDT